jgi:hypothetical protein
MPSLSVCLIEPAQAAGAHRLDGVLDQYLTSVPDQYLTIILTSVSDQYLTSVLTVLQAGARRLDRVLPLAIAIPWLSLSPDYRFPLARRQELIALAACSLVGCCFGCMPPSGGFRCLTSV